MSDKTHFSKLCEDAWLKLRVSAGMMCKTRLDEDDGKRHLVPLGREYIHSRANPQSRVFVAIPGRTVIGPVLKVQIAKILGQLGLEIAIPSPHNHETSTHVVITRGTNRFVDEVHEHKVEFRPSTELLSALQKSEGRESCVEESNNCNMETCAHHFTSRYGNKESSCKQSQQSSQSFIYVQKDYHSYKRKEVGGYSRQSFVRRSSVNTGPQNGYKDGTSLRSRRTRT